MSTATIAPIASFNSALAAVQKSVIIEIADDDLQTLKAANYKLCFAKKVNDTYNVVWESYSDYLANNNFSWTPQYQLFGSNLFQDNITVQVSTNLVSIGIGEKSTLDSAGVLGPASTNADAPTAITMVNDFGSIHPGVNQLSTGINGKQISTPIYVAENVSVEGDLGLTPVEFVEVWFEQNVETSTIFSTARSNSVEIDLTQVNSATRRYSNQRWITP